MVNLLQLRARRWRAATAMATLVAALVAISALLTAPLPADAGPPKTVVKQAVGD